MKRLYSLALLMLTMVCTAWGATVKVEMNSTSRTMTLAAKGSDKNVETGDAEKYIYTFDVDPGTYVLTGYASDGTTVNGTIEITVTDEPDQYFKILTNTIYATNKGWTMGTDYTIDVTVSSREGKQQVITVGNSTTSGRKTFLALNGNSYYAEYIPSDEHKAEGYLSLFKSATLTYGVTASGAIPMGGDYTISLPKDAEFYLGIKFAHFTDFQKVEPTAETVEGDVKKLTYRLAASQCYNYRTWRKGGLTQGGYFYMNLDEAKRPALAFTDADYAAFGVKQIEHDVQWNKGYETGDILVNVNERGHLRLNVGDTFNAHAMRSWQLTDNSTNNYFIEPDFHYTVIDLNGKPSEGVISLDNGDTTTDPWTRIKAIGKGTAIVLVTYDAIGLNYYGSGKTAKTPYLGGEYWSAIWPENTAAYVVTVGEDAPAIDANMVINEKYNLDTKKNAGKYVDAEHDIFYYLDTEEGASYTFTPTGVEKVDMARPVIGEQMATYNGFSTDGVTKNEDGSYTLLLKEGRQIVRLTDAEGNAAYQVLTAKTCHREITNLTREGSDKFYPGDEVSIQYSGLRHPANKLAGIYNMSGYVTYNGIPNGTSLILGAGQYTFGSAPKAQLVKVTIPEDYEAPAFVLNEGVIQVNGYGDPIGNHRLIDPKFGRSANFTAIAHKTYFGMIPDVTIPVSADMTDVVDFEDVDLAGAEYYNGADEAGLFMSSDYSFLNSYDKTYASWSGFALSGTTGKDYQGWGTPSEFNSCVGGGKNSKQFAVGYYAEYTGVGPQIYATQAYKPEYVYVTNAAYTYSSMLNGDSYAKKFTDEDWLVLTITGYTIDGAETGHVDFYLAKDGNIVNEWTKVALSPLGAVDYMEFTMKSSDTGAWGMNTPAYFCLDNMKSVLTDEKPIPSGIENVNGSAAKPSVIGIYTIDGVRISKPQHGVNIIRMSDGSARQVIIR